MYFYLPDEDGARVEITCKFPVTCRYTGRAHTQQWRNMHGKISHVMIFACTLALAFHRSYVKFLVAGSEKRIGFKC